MEARIFNLIILDASGSMAAIYQEALTGVNETLETIRIAQNDTPNLEQYITLASFSKGRNFLVPIFTAQHIDEVHNITEEDYPLRGATALYDAMGTMICEMRQRINNDDRVLVTIITDGYENASQTWTEQRVKSLVDELRHTGWTFTYIGANQDVEKVASTIGVHNSMCFQASEEGTKAMFAMERRSRTRFYEDMSICLDRDKILAKEECIDYFKEQ